MRNTVSVREFRENLAQYLRQAEAGNEIVVTSHGKSIAKLAPVTIGKPRVFGVMRGKIRMAQDFQETPDDIIGAMEGGSGE